MDFRVRPAQPTDIPAIARVHVDTWRTAYQGIIPQEHLDALSYARREQAWAGILSKGDPKEHNLVGVVGTTVAGFVSGGPHREGPGGEIYAIYVREEYQGFGLGRSLVTAALALLERPVFVWVLAANSARGFYERMGAELVANKTEAIGGQPLEELCFRWA